MKELRELRAADRPSESPKAEILRFAQNDKWGSRHDRMGAHHDRTRARSDKTGVFLSKRVRLDSIPPSGGSGIDPSKKLELPPTKKDDLKAPSKKSGSTIKKEKPKQMPPKVKGAELWSDCPAEFLKYAKEGMVSARVTIPGPGFVLKEAGLQSRLFITDPSTVLPRQASEQVGTRAPEASEKLDSALKSSSSTTSKSKPTSLSRSLGTSPKLKGKSK